MPKLAKPLAADARILQQGDEFLKLSTRLGRNAAYRPLNWQLLTGLVFYLEVGRFYNLYSSWGLDRTFQQINVGHPV